MTRIMDYLQKLFENHVRVILSMIGALLYNFFFPTTQYLYGAIAVLVMMVLDLLTKLYSLKRQAGGWKASIAAKKINSFSLFRGTIDKLIVLGVMMIICGCAYQLTLIADIAIWFTQVVYILMFLRDALSIIENLRDAGVQNLGMFEKVVRKKMSEYVDDSDLSDDNNDEEAKG
jgi:hypothetical protein